jgi:hypothetical protein
MRATGVLAEMGEGKNWCSKSTGRKYLSVHSNRRTIVVVRKSGCIHGSQPKIESEDAKTVPKWDAELELHGPNLA